MKILILGSGGREHTFAWKISQSPSCSNLFIAPGNAGTDSLGTNVAINPNDFKAIKEFCLLEKIEMVIVGPENPLVEGIFDFFQNDIELQNIQVIGPSQKGAMLEGSKIFAKEFMEEFGIPTAKYRKFSKKNIQNGIDYIQNLNPPIVLKADGLAAGKGVVICQNTKHATEEFTAMLSGKFGKASKNVVIEDFLTGLEFSVFVLTDGENYKILPIAKDYKKIGEGDTGLNTGGMGAISPVPFVTPDLMKKVEEKIINPTIHGIKKRKINYNGFIFFGLINVENEPFVIEYNCRMGDPETEVVLPRLKNDIIELFSSLKSKSLDKQSITIDNRAATTIILASGGYPETYEKGKEITGIEKVKNSIIFHAGTKKQNDRLLTNGGRVIAITSFGKNVKEALSISNKNAETVNFAGKYFRRDIGFEF